MAIRRRYVVANSDPYTDGTVRPPEELQAAVRRISTVPLTLGHPPMDRLGIPPDQLLGKAEYQYNAEGKRMLAKVSYYDEYFDRLSKELQAKVVNHQNMPLSPGFGFEWGDEPQTLTNIVPAHLAVLTDEKPLCPLNKCGVNVRMESNSGFRMEQRTDAKDLDAKDGSPKEEKTEIQMLRDELAEVKDLLRESLAPKKEEPVVVAHEVEKTQAETAPKKEPEPVRAPEPARETPASAPEPQDEFERDPLTGGIILRSRHDRSKEV